MFLFVLARALGWSIRQVENLDADEVADWRAFYALEAEAQQQGDLTATVTRDLTRRE